MAFVPPPPAYLPLARIERTIEEQLHAAGFMPPLTSPVVDIEAFLETFLKVRVDQYAELASDELGVTHFQFGQPPRVEINQDLTGLADEEDGPLWHKARWRSTLSHEAAHVVFHRADFENGTEQPSLFGESLPDTFEPRLHRCLKRDLGYRPRRVDPREYQANAGMAAILMPRPLFFELAVPLLRPVALRLPGDPAFEEVVRELAERFQVSRQATRIRIETLGLPALCDQSVLTF